MFGGHFWQSYLSEDHLEPGLRVNSSTNQGVPTCVTNFVNVVIEK
jgi:hypothetical protein